jgi:hypothetical protein
MLCNPGTISGGRHASLASYSICGIDIRRLPTWYLTGPKNCGERSAYLLSLSSKQHPHCWEGGWARQDDWSKNRLGAS